MVDSSVGGKTGIDYNGIKNLVGSFYQPKGVFVDPYLLKTLPDRQIKSGICESYKMAACFDSSLFKRMSKGISESDYFDIITKSIELKKDVVEKDEKESNLRRVLNFGHTLGHGIEEACNHTLYHGECVGLGMIAITKGDVQKQILAGIEKIGLPTKAYFDKDKAIDNILHDKKGTDNGIVYIALDEIGKFSFEVLDFNKVSEMLDYVLLR
jgi:3-dehydroquinate synthase